jgi:hypothetical protein
MLNFLSAVFDTARNWRDTVQTFMPASRGRIAWVRQRRNEGGTNLFMRNEDIAALALRGAVAGARLRRRFASEAQWQRHQWLRLRGGLKNLADLDTRIQQALREARYARLTGGCTEATAAMSDTVRELKKAADPTPPGADPFSSPSTSGEEPMAAARAAISDSDGVAELPFEWFEPQGNDFWLAAQRLLATHNSMDLPTTPLSTRAPEPTAALRQVPPI